MATGSFIVEARQRQSDKVAFAVGVVAGGAPKVKMGIQVGKPGDLVELSAQGFSADEEISVYWNGLDGLSVAHLRSDPEGSVRQGSVRVPFGAVGNNAFVFVGQKSQSPVTLPFLLLNLFPSVQLSTYAVRADNVLSFSGKDFGPEEQVTIHLNSPDGAPIATIQAAPDGTFTNAGSVLIPFGLSGRQTLIFIGEQSRAPATATFDIQPYTPNVQPSTYGGRPGTVVTFYGTGFARDEVVLAYLGRTRESPGRLVSCFAADAQGNAAAAGSYVIPGDAVPGQQVITLVGRKSEGIASAAIEVMATEVPVQSPAQPEFQCPLPDDDDASSAQPRPSDAAGSGPVGAAPTPASPAPAKPGSASTPSSPAPAKPAGAPVPTPTAPPKPGGAPTQAPAAKPAAPPSPSPTRASTGTTAVSGKPTTAAGPPAPAPAGPTASPKPGA